MKILVDTHTHTVHSGHAYSTVNENLKYASKKGLDLVCLTDHAFSLPGATHSFYFFNLKVIPSELYGVKLLKGCELNILDEDGSLDDFKKEVSQDCYDNLEYRIASLHPPCLKPENKDYTKTLLNTMKNNNIDCLGHLGDPRYSFDIDEVVKFARDNNTLIELNNSSLRPNSPRFNNDIILKIVDSCYRHNAFMTFGSDAHFSTEVGGFGNIEKLFEEFNIPYDNIITADTDKFLNYIKQNRGN